jgi:hypothetical protein
LIRASRQSIRLERAIGGSEKSRFLSSRSARRLLGAGVLGYGLRSLADGVLGEFTGQQETDGRLNFSARDGRATVIVRQTRGFGGDTFEDIVDEAVHDRHGLAADSGVRMDLLEHLVNVNSVALASSALLFLIPSSHGLGLAGGLLRSLASWLRRHRS